MKTNLLSKPNDIYHIEDLPGEIWKPIIEKRYEVSNFGRVKSLIGNPKILKQYTIYGGYRQVKLSLDNSYLNKRVHRLVYMAFNENFNELLEIHHKDQDTSNNCLSNLEALTHKDHVKKHNELKSIGD